MAEGRAAEGRAAEGREAEGRAVEGRAAEGRAAGDGGGRGACATPLWGGAAICPSPPSRHPSTPTTTSLPSNPSSPAGMLYIVSWAFLVALVVSMFVSSSALALVLSAVGAVLFSFYLVFDLQAVMGGGSGGATAVTLSPDEYVFAALNIYLDAVNVFINVLQLVQAAGANGQ